ncbi:MAG: transposase, partial [Deltaproteobacteria bacterium]|nr:transposase [Deltaproteobacteria bacterium]
DEIKAVITSARLYVCSHLKKRFVIALKYEGEERYRYLSASDMSWRTVDIVQAYTLRWLVEVFHEDWKSYEGWGKLTKQQGVEGSSRSLILSLLTDHCLLLHPEQLARIENKLPAYTVGSLQARVKIDSLVADALDILSSENPEERLDQVSMNLKNIFQLKPSKKHLIGRELGRLGQTPALKYRAAA